MMMMMMMMKPEQTWKGGGGYYHFPPASCRGNSSMTPLLSPSAECNGPIQRLDLRWLLSSKGLGDMAREQYPDTCPAIRYKTQLRDDSSKARLVHRSRNWMFTHLKHEVIKSWCYTVYRCEFASGDHASLLTMTAARELHVDWLKPNDYWRGDARDDGPVALIPLSVSWCLKWL